MIYYPINKIPCICDGSIPLSESNKLISELIEWLKDRQVNCWVEKNDRYEYTLVFSEPDEAMMFKLTWM